MVDVAYRVDGGAGPWLLLIRPLGGSKELWGRFRDQLVPHARVISYDPRGTGDSPRLPRGASLRDSARDAIALLDHLGVERAFVIGESLGGMIGSWLAADFADRVPRLVLISTPARGIATVASLRGAGRGLALAECFVRPSAARCLAHHMLSHEFRAREPERARAIEDAIAAEGIRRGEALRLLASAARYRSPAIPVPVLRLRGAHDPLVREGEVIAGAGHAVTYEAPVEAAARARAFLFG